MYKVHGGIRLSYCSIKKLNIKTQVTHKVKDRADCLQFIFQMSQTTFTLTNVVIVNECDSNINQLLPIFNNHQFLIISVYFQ